MSGLQASGVHVTRGGRLVVDDVDITVPPGSLGALLGPNGAGKSTLLHAIAAASPARSMMLHGEDLGAMRRRRRAQIVALVEQEPPSNDLMRVRDIVALGRIPHEGAWGGASPVDLDVIARSMDAAGAGDLASRVHGTLSGGEKQRVHLARALAQEPELMLLDEPTNHLDVRSQLSTLALLRRLAEGGLTVLAALHDLNLTTAFADHVIVMREGRVVAAGTPGDIITAELIHDVWGVRSEILPHPSTGRPVVIFSALSTVVPERA